MAPDLEAQPVPLERIPTASTTSSTGFGEDDDHHHGEALNRALSRVQTWALEYVDLDFSVQDRALETLKASLSPDQTTSSTTLHSLNLHVAPPSWPLARKVRALFFPCIAALLAGYAAGSYASAGPFLKPLWSLTPAAYNTGITTFVIGFGLAPVVLALLSEIYGRYWIFVSCGVVFLLGTTGCAVTDSFAGMLVARFVTGAGASVFATLTAGVVSDLFPGRDERGLPMALYSLCLCAGTGVGPLVSGVIAAKVAAGGESGEGEGVLSWRWIFYIQMMLITVVTVAVALVFEETRANVLLARNCKVLNAHIEQLEKSGDVVESQHTAMRSSQSGSSSSMPQGQTETPRRQLQPRTRFRVPQPSSSSAARPSLLSQIWRSLCFPLQLLATEPIVSCFSAWVSFAWAILYMQFATIPRVFRDVYGLDDLRLGLVYLAVIVGCVIGCVLCIVWEKLGLWEVVVPVAVKTWQAMSRRKRTAETNAEEKGQHGPRTDQHKPYKPARDDNQNPERRIYFACIGTLLLPSGLFMFGWTTTTSHASSAPSFHPIVPVVAVTLSVTGIFIIYLSVFNYLADAYGRFASSAQAAQSLCRNLLAGVLPLVADAMFDRLGYAGGESLLGAIAVVLCCVPWALCVCGETIRARSRFAKELEP